MDLALTRFTKAGGSRVWLIVALIICTVTMTPLLFALSSLVSADIEIWSHLLRYVLPDVFINSICLALGVGAGCAIIGTGLAWLTAACEFPGRRFFDWALLLPLALPGYVCAFALSGVFDYTGTLQTAMRELFGDAQLPGIGARWASIITLTLVSYPYVYLILRQAFLSRGARSLEVAQSLGLSPAAGFFKVTLPMARPWIAIGTALVVMESLADFGTVSVFNYSTFTTAIYESWFGLFSLQTALQLALLLVAIVAAALYVERRFRSRARYTETDLVQKPARIQLRGPMRWFATFFPSTIFLFAFVIPVLQLLWWSLRSFTDEFTANYLVHALRTVTLSVGASVLICSIALLLAYSVRQGKHPVFSSLARIATLGYAIPGAVLAVGFFVAVSTFGNILQGGFSALFGSSAPTIALGSGLFALLLAYAARFLAIAHGTLDAALLRITSNLDDAARTMGASGLTLLRRVHIPLLRPAATGALILVFVEVMKELPITLMTRPFGWDTLAVRIYQLTSEGHWQRAALPSLLIVMAGLLPVYLLNRQASRHA